MRSLPEQPKQGERVREGSQLFKKKKNTKTQKHKNTKTQKHKKKKKKTNKQ